MYGASGKMGRGGAGKRNIHAPPIGRPTPAGRMSMGGGPRGRGAAASSPSTSVEESFSLVRETPLNFGMAIKLAPDLVEEIKRVEAQGSMGRIKFGAIAGENVIQVGEKTFKFTWSREPGDLCDIYEECGSGDGGNGLLVESGGTWRKLNVERELDESTKNHVKRRSEEAERKLKSRKAIVLDHQNPAMKNQMKAFAASESNQGRSFKNRREPPSKKLKTEPAFGGPPKSFYKPGLPSSTISKVPAGSPLSSQPEQLAPSTSPVESGDVVKEHIVVSDFAAPDNLNKVFNSAKDIANKRNSTIFDKSKHNQNIAAKPADLRSLMISLLLEHQPTGMSLKALEKAIGDAKPNSARKIEPILKQIANYQAPGRYLLKPGIEMESFKKLPRNGSSPETNRDHLTTPLKFDRLPDQDPSIPITTMANYDECGEMNPLPPHTADMTEKIDPARNSPENSSDKNVSQNNDGIGDSSSDSDSESNNSDSGSDSGRSHSKSQSQSRGGSSSDSDGGASSSKQASDEDIDIMLSDDDKESKLTFRNPVQWSNSDDGYVDIVNSENQDRSIEDAIEIDIVKDFDTNDHGAGIIAPNHLFADKESKDIKPYSADEEKRVHEKKAYDDGSDSDINDGIRGESSQINSKHSGERAHIKKKSKSRNSIEPVSGTINSLFGESPSNSSPDRPTQESEKRPVDLIEERSTRNDITSSQAIYRPLSDSLQPARVWTDGEKRPGKNNGKSEHKNPNSGDRSLAMNGQSRLLRGEHSGLELGEFREPFHEETLIYKKQIERKSSFKHLENKQTSDEYWISDFEAKTSNRIPADLNGDSKKKILENYVDELTRPHHLTTRPPKAGSASVEANGETSQKNPTNSIKHSKKQKSNKVGVSKDRQIDALPGGNNTRRKKILPSSNDSCPFTKFEKEEPELKGPIRDISRYKEYVKEYQEKYESYSSLNKILESYRDEFSELGNSLETHKGRDMKRYKDVLQQMRSSFHQSGEKHKRQKHIFVVLHEELKHLKQMIKDYAASSKKS